MINLTRRNLLDRRRRGLRRDRADAACPFAGLRRGAARHTQAPGWYRYNVGSYQITVVTDGSAASSCPTPSSSTPRRTR